MSALGWLLCFGVYASIGLGVAIALNTLPGKDDPHRMVGLVIGGIFWPGVVIAVMAMRVLRP